MEAEEALRDTVKLASWQISGSDTSINPTGATVLKTKQKAVLLSSIQHGTIKNT